MSSSAARPGWQQKFTFLWTGSVASQLGSMTAAVASPLLALLLTGSAVFVGWVAAASTLPGVLLQIPAGLLVDRVRNKRLLMMTSQAIHLCSTVIFLLGLFLSKEPHVFLIIAVTIDGICTTFYNLAEITVIRDLVPEENRNSAATKDEVRGHISQVLGRSSGGYLFGISHSLPYLFDAIASVATLIILHLAGRKNQTDDPEEILFRRPPDNLGFSLLTGWREVWGDSYLRQVVTACALVNFLLQGTILLLLVWAQEEGYSSTEIGILLAASGVFGIVGSIVTEKWFIPSGEQARRTTFVCFWLWVALMAGVCWSPSPHYGLLFWGMFSVVGAYINIALRCHQTTEVREEILGRVTSICKFITGGAIPLGALAAGYAIDRWKSQEIMLVTTLMMAGFVILVTRRSIFRALRAAVARVLRPRRADSSIPREHALTYLRSPGIHDDQNRSKTLQPLKHQSLPPK